MSNFNDMSYAELSKILKATKDEIIRKEIYIEALDKEVEELKKKYRRCIEI